MGFNPSTNDNHPSNSLLEPDSFLNHILWRHSIWVNKTHRIINTIIIRRPSSIFFSQRIYIHPSTNCRIIISSSIVVHVKPQLVLQLLSIILILIRIGKNSNNRNLIKTYITENVYLTFFYSTNLEKIIVS